ncbi:MAG: transglycosylase SLT domain-containing protein [Candidatus Korobacteraceae bacterium]
MNTNLWLLLLLVPVLLAGSQVASTPLPVVEETEAVRMVASVRGTELITDALQHTAAEALPAPALRTSKSSVRALIKNAAIEHGIDPTIALFIVEKESQFDHHAKGDGHLPVCPIGPNQGKPQRSRGLWQINDCYHHEVSDAIAFDPVKSTAWALRRIKRGYIHEWSTWVYRERYKDSPAIVAANEPG